MTEENAVVPSISNHLWACLSAYQTDHEGQYAAPQTSEERTLHDSMHVLENFALRLIKTGIGTEQLEDAFSGFMPGSNVSEKISSLLGYNLARDRLEFSVAYTVIDRLAGIRRRIEYATFAYTLLLRSEALRRFDERMDYVQKHGPLELGLSFRHFGSEGEA